MPIQNKTRIVFCTYSSLYSSIMLENLIADQSVEVVAIINSTRIIHPKYGFVRGAIKQIQVSGWRYASYLFMVTDLFRWLQPFTGLKKSVHSLAKQYGISLLDTLDINQEESIEFINKNKPDFLLAGHFNQLIKPVILNLPNVDCINIHPSLLPAYKGVDPVFHALLDHQTEIGVTLHKMSETFDSGKILSQQSVLIRSKQSVFFYNCQLFEEGAKLALQWLNNQDGMSKANTDKNIENVIKNDAKNSIENNGNYDSWPSKLQSQKFKQSSNKLIGLLELWKY